MFLGDAFMKNIVAFFGIDYDSGVPSVGIALPAFTDGNAAASSDDSVCHDSVTATLPASLTATALAVPHLRSSGGSFVLSNSWATALLSGFLAIVLVY